MGEHLSADGERGMNPSFGFACIQILLYLLRRCLNHGFSLLLFDSFPDGEGRSGSTRVSLPHASFRFESFSLSGFHPFHISLSDTQLQEAEAYLLCGPLRAITPFMKSCSLTSYCPYLIWAVCWFSSSVITCTCSDWISLLGFFKLYIQFVKVILNHT